MLLGELRDHLAAPRKAGGGDRIAVAPARRGRDAVAVAAGQCGQLVAGQLQSGADGGVPARDLAALARAAEDRQAASAPCDAGSVRAASMIAASGSSRPGATSRWAAY